MKRQATVWENFAVLYLTKKEPCPEYIKTFIINGIHFLTNGKIRKEVLCKKKNQMANVKNFTFCKRTGKSILKFEWHVTIYPSECLKFKIDSSNVEEFVGGIVNKNKHFLKFLNSIGRS